MYVEIKEKQSEVSTTELTEILTRRSRDHFGDGGSRGREMQRESRLIISTTKDKETRGGGCWHKGLPNGPVLGSNQTGGDLLSLGSRRRL
ncbi:hypothetical protein F2Q68_00038664 [Brassica cretica]|uniref:Uncharacterized protein n=1 Tax=Brassica cretica TaxID=69181 RepID=A0A8S9MCL2_BRACR|nr:hypothetical protein F2Q68_00038664 [Brassica cretica]